MLRINCHADTRGNGQAQIANDKIFGKGRTNLFGNAEDFLGIV